MSFAPLRFLSRLIVLVVQVLTGLNLSIKKTYISLDGQWFMDDCNSGCPIENSQQIDRIGALLRVEEGKRGVWCVLRDFRRTKTVDDDRRMRLSLAEQSGGGRAMGAVVGHEAISGAALD
ncbi:hypothetical protein COLO4_34129 [Corchorus olitorius]|uniref:Uncharacterized protein n=1 Tax=Corchorus olitorius TaxID=93759 RepID=A0A1R3GNN2_9ROSI|nr:hypothetical protein COLO4_34129 [Corchorus olitorius]